MSKRIQINGFVFATDIHKLPHFHFDIYVLSIFLPCREGYETFLQRCINVSCQPTIAKMGKKLSFMQEIDHHEVSYLTELKDKHSKITNAKSITKAHSFTWRFTAINPHCYSLAGN